jgi:hypothetical protein
MTVPCGTSAEELREAFFLNLNAAICWKFALGNVRFLTISSVLLVAAIGQMATGKADLKVIAVLAGLLALMLAGMWFRLTRSLGKAARALSASGGQMSIEAQGITTAMPSGARTFVPWSAFAGWREGKLVFTVGDAKAYRTISKRALGIRADEVRSVLLSQVRAVSR